MDIKGFAISRSLIYSHFKNMATAKVYLVAVISHWIIKHMWFDRKKTGAFFTGDSLKVHNWMPFSTYDRDNDNLANGSCSLLQGGSGGWWFNSCLDSNGNGRFYKKGELHPDGIQWKKNQSRLYGALTGFAMLIKPYIYWNDMHASMSKDMISFGLLFIIYRHKQWKMHVFVWIMEHKHVSRVFCPFGSSAWWDNLHLCL